MKSVCFGTLFFVCLVVQSFATTVSSSNSVPRETNRAKKIRKSLDLACGVFEKALAKTQLETHKDQVLELESYVETNLQTKIKNRSVIQIWQNMKLADPRQKSDFWALAAHDLGVRSWSCVAIDDFYGHLEKYKGPK